MELPFLKKKSEAAVVPLVPSWHPNFRNYEKLPDIKVVRTAFFVNVAAVAIACVALAIFGLQEYKLFQLNSQLAELQRQIDRDKKKSDQAVGLFKKFQSEEAKLTEVDAFRKSKPVISDLLLRLGQTLPKNIAMDSFDIREAGLALRVSVRGAADAASSVANAYLEQLRSDKELARFEDFAITNFSRNPGTGRLSVDIFLKLKPATPPAAAKK
jgi:uncharacterized coiled-coil protein SlyX